MLSVAPINYDRGNKLKLKILFSGIEFWELNMKNKCTSN
jgi:hypothetical protein